MSDLLATVLLVLYGAGTWSFLTRSRLRNPRPSRPLERVLSAAAYSVKKQGRTQMTSEDFVHAALFDRAVAQALDARGIVVVDVRSAIAAHVATMPAGPRDPGVAIDVKVALFHAKEVAVKANRLEIDTIDVVDALASAPSSFVGRAFAEGRRHASDAVAAPPDPLDASPPSSLGYRVLAPPILELVVFWNDDRTTMEFVQLVLAECFAKADVETTLIMLTVHQEGAAPVGAYSPEEARERVRRATALIASHGMPLRITIEPMTFRPPRKGLWARIWATSPP